MPPSASHPAESLRLLWLLRHAKTVQDPPAGGGDHERRLAPRGRRDADALGARLGDGGDRLGYAPERLPQLVLTSTATRTLQTVERALGAMAHPPPVQAVRGLYQASPEEVLEEVRRIDDQVGAVMVVGHNPTAQHLAAEMSAGGDHEGRRTVEKHGFPTCALAVFRLPLPHWAEVSMGGAALDRLVVPPY